MPLLIGVSSCTLLEIDSLNFATMAHFEMKNQRWVLPSDLFYVKLEGSDDVALGAGSATAADVTGNGHDGTLVNMDPATDWVGGLAGLALDFDGVDDYVSVPDHAALDFGLGDFSVILWVFKHSPTVNFDNSYGVSKWSTGGTGFNEWCLLVGSGLVTGDTPSFWIEIGTTWYNATDPQGISLNEWHQVVGVRRGTAISLYVDGILAARNSSIPPGAAINNGGRELRIAVNQPDAPLFYTDALFDDVQIYDFALRDGDVAIGQVAGGHIPFLYANPGMSVAVFSDGFESGDTLAWSNTVP